MADTTSDSAPSHFDNLSTYEQRVVKYNIDRQRGKSAVTDSDKLKKYVASEEFTEDQRRHFAAIMFKGAEGKQKLIDAYEKHLHESGPEPLPEERWARIEKSRKEAGELSRVRS